MNRVLSEMLAELRAIRESVEEIRRALRGEDDSHADFISARKAAQILGIKTVSYTHLTLPTILRV